MRRSVACIFLYVFGGCATVSVLPSSTAIETNVAEEQSALRTASERFRDEALERGWMREAAGFASIANTLMNGASEADQTPAYADRLLNEAADPTDAFMRLETDVYVAREQLSRVTDEAETLIASGDATAARRDVYSFERALVAAQQARRAFISAAASAGAETPNTTALALEALEIEIDRARRAADRLADQYASRPAASS